MDCIVHGVAKRHNRETFTSLLSSAVTFLTCYGVLFCFLINFLIIVFDLQGKKW